MSRTGSCLDNAVAESWFASLKVELVSRTHDRTRAEARTAIVAWIAWYNRVPAALGQRLPVTHRVGAAARHHEPATIDHGRRTPVSTSRGGPISYQRGATCRAALAQFPGLWPVR
jgi:hypothetical protein